VVWGIRWYNKCLTESRLARVRYVKWKSLDSTQALSPPHPHPIPPHPHPMAQSGLSNFLPWVGQLRPSCSCVCYLTYQSVWYIHLACLENINPYRNNKLHQGKRDGVISYLYSRTPLIYENDRSSCNIFGWKRVSLLTRRRI
jgi:hypothetical protein